LFYHRQAGGVELDLLCHVNGPDARSAAKVQDSRRIVGIVYYGGRVQQASARNLEDLVKDVHAIFLGLDEWLAECSRADLDVGGCGGVAGRSMCLSSTKQLARSTWPSRQRSTAASTPTPTHLIARVHVHAATIAMVHSVVFRVVGQAGCRDGHAGRRLAVSQWVPPGGTTTARSPAMDSARGRRHRADTHPFEAIVGMGAAGARKQPETSGRRAAGGDGGRRRRRAEKGRERKLQDGRMDFTF
jgi:hypothetical protein